MNKSLSARIMDLLQRRQLKGTLAKIALTISCVAIFLITYLLVAPVLTQEWETVCGMEEHVHTEECYTLVPADSAEAAEPTGAVKPAEPAEPAQGGHHHTEECYEEVPAEPGEGGHHHTDECYEEVIVEPAVEGHSHTSDCYEESSSLSCGMSEHSHSDGCLDEEGNQVCGMDEHSHSDSCYETSSELVCGQEETEGREAKTERQLICGQEETDGQEPATERRLVCGMEESDGAEETTGETAEEPAGEGEAEEAGEADAEGQEPEMVRVLTCGKEEHVHSDQCYQKHEISGPEYICGFLTEHAHDDSCYFESGELKCTIPEHTHDDSCLPAQTLGGQNNHIGDGIFPEELPEGYQEANVFQPDGAMFAMTDEDGANQQSIQARVYMPENAFGTEVMFVPQPLDETDEAYAAFAAKLAETEDYDNLTAMDLGFVAADEESENYGNFLEPNTESGPVYVRLTVPMEISEETELAFWHYVNDGEEAAEGAAEKVTADFTYEDGVLTVDFAADSFSAFGITTRAQAAEGSNLVTWGAAKAGSEDVASKKEDGVDTWDVSQKKCRYLEIPVIINVTEKTAITLPKKVADIGRSIDSKGTQYEPELDVAGIAQDNEWTVEEQGDNVVINHTAAGHGTLLVYYKFDCWNVISGREFTINATVHPEHGGTRTDVSLTGKIVTGNGVKFESYANNDSGESIYSFNGFGGADKNTAYIPQWNSVYETYFGLSQATFDKGNYIYDIAPFVIKPQYQQPYNISGTIKPNNSGEVVGGVYMMKSREDPDDLCVKVETGNAAGSYSFEITNDKLKLKNGQYAVVSELEDTVDNKEYTLYFLVRYPRSTLDVDINGNISLNADLSLTHTGIDPDSASASASDSTCLYNGKKDPRERIYWAAYVSNNVQSGAGLTNLKSEKTATMEFSADFFCLNEARDSFNAENPDKYRLEAIIDLSYLNNDKKTQLETGDYRFSGYRLSLIDAPGNWSYDNQDIPRVGWTPSGYQNIPEWAKDEEILIYGSTSLINNGLNDWAEIGRVKAADVWAINDKRAFKEDSTKIDGNYVRLKVVYNSRLTTALRVGYEMEIRPEIMDKYGISNEAESLELINWFNYLAYTAQDQRDLDMKFNRYPVHDGLGWDAATVGTMENARAHDATWPYPGYKQPEDWYSLTDYSLRNFARSTLKDSKDSAGMIVTQALYDSNGKIVGDPTSVDLSTRTSYSLQENVTNVSEVVYNFSGAITSGATSLKDLQERINNAAAYSPYKSLKMRYYVRLPEGLKLNTNPDNGEKDENGAPKYHFWSEGTTEYLSAVSAFYNNNSSKVVQGGQTDVPVSAARIKGWNERSANGNLSEMYWVAGGSVTHDTVKSSGQLVVFERTLGNWADYDRFNMWGGPGDGTFFWGRGLSFSAVPVDGTGTLPEGDYTAEFWCQFLDGDGNPIKLNEFNVNDGRGAATEDFGDPSNKGTLMYIPIQFHNNSGRGDSEGKITVSVDDKSLLDHNESPVVAPEGTYQYELKYEVSAGEKTRNVVLWCNIEEHVDSEWKGIVQGVDTNNTGAKVYVRTEPFAQGEYLANSEENPAQQSWLTDEKYGWSLVNGTTDWSKVKAVAFSFGDREFSVGNKASVFIKMKALEENDIPKKVGQEYYETRNAYIITNVRDIGIGGKTLPTSWLEGPTTLYIKPKYPLGYILPSTGGAGSATMCATGMALILAAMGLMYLTLRRSRKQREGGNV